MELPTYGVWCGGEDVCLVVWGWVHWSTSRVDAGTPTSLSSVLWSTRLWSELVSRLQSSTTWCDCDMIWWGWDVMWLSSAYMTLIKDFAFSSVICESRFYLNCDLWMFGAVCVTMNVNKTNKNNVSFKPPVNLLGKIILSHIGLN